MSLRREELLRQKALVEEQLRWIDAKLAVSEEGSGESKPSAPPPYTVPLSPTQPPQASDATPAYSGPSYSSDGPVEGISPGQKLGCIILVIIVCAGVLASLFVLPYLLY